MEVTVYKRRPGRGASAVITPYPFNGTRENTGQRLQHVANVTGIDIIGFPRMGTGQNIGSLTLRKQLKRRDFAEMNAALAQEIAPEVRTYDQLLAWGDSTAGQAVGPLILSNLLPISHALFRDAANLKAPQAPLLGQATYFRYQLVNERVRPRHQSDWRPPTTNVQQPSNRAQQALHIANEIFHYSPLWRSTYSIEMLKQIASDHTSLPMRMVYPSNTFTSTPEQARNFASTLAALRGQTTSTNVAPIQSIIAEGWYHSDLENPDKSITDVLGALALPDGISS